MSGERDLAKLLAGLSPLMGPETYVFASVPAGTDISGLSPIMQFTEEEGLTLILERRAAEAAGLAYDFPCRRISLAVHSALDAAGLMAAVSVALTEAGIACNPVAGFHHDHLFVPEARAAEALGLLQAMSSV